MKMKRMVHLVEEEVEAFGLEVPTDAPKGLYYSSLDSGFDRQIWFDSYELLDSLNVDAADVLVTPDADRIWPDVFGELGGLFTAHDVYEELVIELEAEYRLDDEVRALIENLIEAWDDYMVRHKLN